MTGKAIGNHPQKSKTTQVGKPLSKVLRGLGRGFGGALIFALPMLMTMEMWHLGFHLDRLRLALLLVVNIPLLIALSYHAGFEQTKRWRDDLRDTGIAFGIGLITSAATLLVLGLIKSGMTPDEIVGKIAVQTVPASIGALLGSSQLGSHKADVAKETEAQTYLSELFLMGIGALFLGLNVAPTEEMLLISFKMTPWHAVSLIMLSILLMHGFTYALEFSGTAPIRGSAWGAFFRFTLTGYGIAVGVSLYVLWTFGQTSDAAAAQVVMSAVVLGFPAAIGAAAARLII